MRYIAPPVPDLIRDLSADIETPDQAQSRGAMQ